MVVYVVVVVVVEVAVVLLVLVVVAAGVGVVCVHVQSYRSARLPVRSHHQYMQHGRPIELVLPPLLGRLLDDRIAITSLHHCLIET